MILGGIELCLNIFPPRVWMSLLLFGLHTVILIGCLFLSKYPASPYKTHVKKVKTK